MSGDTQLPPGFEALEPFVAMWSLDRAADRAQRRLDSSAPDREAFFAVASELAAPALEFLDQKPLNAFDECEERLMNLMLSLAHVALAVEIQGDDEPAHAGAARHVTITRAVSDQAP
jgi:hypothetical protein